MRRAGSLLVVLALSAGLTPARAGTATGIVRIPVTSPSPGRLLHLATGGASQGLIASVVELPDRPADGTRYALKNLGAVGPTQLSAFFYADLWGKSGEGSLCITAKDVAADGAGGETGSILCGDVNNDGVIDAKDRARWAIIVTFYGPNASYRLTW